jgi:hypothetical protein
MISVLNFSFGPGRGKIRTEFPCLNWEKESARWMFIHFIELPSVPVPPCKFQVDRAFQGYSVWTSKTNN